jgi:dTMP kinase
MCNDKRMPGIVPKCELDLNKGIFISVEGGDGSGKSTQLANIKDYLEARGVDALFIREPGGTSIGEKIRDILLDPANAEMCAMTEAMLYAASRAQIVSEVIKPALSEGKVVVCDRFVDSSIAYQAYGRQMGNAIWDINKYAVDGSMPDYTFFLDINPHIASSRIDSRGEGKDRMELQEDSFRMRVYNGYLALMDDEANRDRIIRIDACKDIESVKSEIIEKLDVILAR